MKIIRRRKARTIGLAEKIVEKFIGALSELESARDVELMVALLRTLRASGDCRNDFKPDTGAQ